MPSKQGPRVVVRITSFDHPKSGLEQLVHGHHINHAVCVTLPASGAAERLEKLCPIGEGGYSVLELRLDAVLEAYAAARRACGGGQRGTTTFKRRRYGAEGAFRCTDGAAATAAPLSLFVLSVFHEKRIRSDVPEAEKVNRPRQLE